MCGWLLGHFCPLVPLYGACTSVGVTQLRSGDRVMTGEGARIRSLLRSGCSGWLPCGCAGASSRCCLGSGRVSCDRSVSCVGRVGGFWAWLPGRLCSSCVSRRNRFRGRKAPGGESPRRPSALIAVTRASACDRVSCVLAPVGVCSCWGGVPWAVPELPFFL